MSRLADPRRLVRVALLLGAALLGGLPTAQEPGGDGAAPESSSQASSAEAPAAAPETFDSPRAVMTAFLERMEERDAARAAECFDPAVRDADDPGPAEQAAEDLYEALNHTRRVDPARLPTGPRAALLSLYTWEASPPGHPSIVTKVGFRRSGGSWYIDAVTFASAAKLREQVEELPYPDELLAGLPLTERLRFRLRESLPRAFLDKAFVLENWQWLALAGLVFLAVLVDRVARFLVGRVLVRLMRTRLEADVLLPFERPVGLLAGAVAFGRLLPLIGLSRGAEGMLVLATSFVATLAGVWAAYSLVDVICRHLEAKAARTANKFDDMLVPLLRRTLKIFVLIVGLVYLASRWTEDLWGVVAGLGIGSLAIGFAARDSIENLFGTFTVLLDKPFQIGDWIVAGDLEGTVETVGFRSTRIRTFYDSVITVPNRTFISEGVDNLGQRRYRRIKTTLGLTYDTPPEKLEAFCEGVRELIRGHPYTRKDYYHVYFSGFGPSSLDVLLYCFVRTPDWGTELREKHRLFADVLRIAEELGVSFAFPTRTVHVAKPEDLEHTGTPADDPAGTHLGREVAARVLAHSLGHYEGQKPPPVATPTERVGADGE